ELLKRSAENDPKQESRFFTVLAELAQKQGLEPADLTTYQTGKNHVGVDSGGKFPSGKAVHVKSGKRQYIVVILESRAIVGHGTEVEQLILLDEGGKVLDKISCAMSTRYGRLQTEVKDKPEDDKAQVIIRFTQGFTPWHAWHLITYKKLAYSFRQKEPKK